MTVLAIDGKQCCHPIMVSIGQPAQRWPLGLAELSLAHLIGAAEANKLRRHTCLKRADILAVRMKLATRTHTN